MSVKMYHNPRCSKSRATLELLRGREIEPEITLYLESPPSEGELASILEWLGCDPSDLMRKGEAEYREQALDNPALSREQLIAAMVACPRLIERPIVVANGRAAVGRPPESVLDIL